MYTKVPRLSTVSINLNESRSLTFRGREVKTKPRLKKFVLILLAVRAFGEIFTFLLWFGWKRNGSSALVADSCEILINYVQIQKETYVGNHCCGRKVFTQAHTNCLLPMMLL